MVVLKKLKVINLHSYFESTILYLFLEKWQFKNTAGFSNLLKKSWCVKISDNQNEDWLILVGAVKTWHIYDSDTLIILNSSISFADCLYSASVLWLILEFMT